MRATPIWPWEGILFQRAFSHIANGVLIYAIFYALLWLLMLKGGLLLQVALRCMDGIPDLVEGVALPFLMSIVAAFLAHAGLRVALRQLKLRLSTDESSASLAFLGVLSLLAFSGTMERLVGTPESMPWTAPSLVLGAWIGIALRRRLPL